MFRNGIEVEAVIHYSSEIESLSLIRTTMDISLLVRSGSDVYFRLWIFPIACMAAFARASRRRQLDIELSS